MSAHGVTQDAAAHKAFFPPINATVSQRSWAKPTAWEREKNEISAEPPEG